MQDHFALFLILHYTNVLGKWKKLASILISLLYISCLGIRLGVTVVSVISQESRTGNLIIRYNEYCFAVQLKQQLNLYFVSRIEIYSEKCNITTNLLFARAYRACLAILKANKWTLNRRMRIRRPPSHIRVTGELKL